MAERSTAVNDFRAFPGGMPELLGDSVDDSICETKLHFSAVRDQADLASGDDVDRSSVVRSQPYDLSCHAIRYNGQRQDCDARRCLIALAPLRAGQAASPAQNGEPAASRGSERFSTNVDVGATENPHYCRPYLIKTLAG
jgi:hypothetical protein